MNLRESRSRREDRKASPNHSQLLYILQNDIHLYIHSFVATDFWITFLLMVLCNEKFLIIGQIENWRPTITFLLMFLITLCTGSVCGIFGAFVTSFGSTNNLHSGKYKVVMDFTLLFEYFKLFRWVDFALSDFESLEITFFSVPPNPSTDPFRCWRSL